MIASGVTETVARTASLRRQASESPTDVVLYGCVVSKSAQVAAQTVMFR